MARDNNRDGIGAIGQPYRSAGSRLADVAGELFIAPGHAIGYFPQGLPDLLLKCCTVWFDRNSELLTRSCEVFSQLFLSLSKYTMHASTKWLTKLMLQRDELLQALINLHEANKTKVPVMSAKQQRSHR